MLLSTVAAIAYGIVHDQITARLCVEYFTIAHPPLFHSTSPTLLGICWGIAATVGVGALLGVVLALVSQSEGLPPVAILHVFTSILGLLAVMAISALLAGGVGFELSRRSIVCIPAALADRIPPSQHHRFMAVWFVHGASYLVGLVGLHEMGSLRSMRPLREGDAVRDVLNTIPDSNEPIVIPDSHVFLELSYYAEPRISRRLVYPISSELDLRYLGYDTDNRNISALSRRANIHARELDSILADSPRFLLVATPRYYLPWHYVEIGDRVLPVPPLATHPVLFEVEAPLR